MTTIETKRVEYITSKHEDYSSEKIEFLVRTGLTFDPSITKKYKGEEKAYKDIDWYYPKGAAFKTKSQEDEGSSSGSEGSTPETPDGDNTQQNISDDVNNPDNNTTVNSTDPDSGEPTSEPLNPNSTIEPITGDDGDDNPDNDPAIGTADGETIILNGDDNQTEP